MCREFLALKYVGTYFFLNKSNDILLYSIFTK